MKEINKIVCFPVTKWHLYGMLSYLVEVYGEEKLEKFDIEVYSIRHSENGYLLSSKDIPYRNMSFHYEDELSMDRKKILKNMSAFWGNSKKRNPEVILMFANNILVRKMIAYVDKLGYAKKNLQVILVDDGIGSYLSEKVWKKCEEAEGGIHLRNQMKSLISNLLRVAVNAKEWHMLLIEDGHLKKLHTKGYFTVIMHDVEKSARKQLIDFKEQYKDTPVALFITQPWSENNQISVTEEKRIIDEVVLELSKSYCVIVKKHPRENKRKYDLKNVVVLGGEYPAEFYLCALKKNDIVIGFNSTALINAAVVFNLNTYTVSDRVVSGNKSNMMEIACKEFLKLTEKMISVFDA